MAVKEDYLRVSKTVKTKALYLRLYEIANEENVNYAFLSHFLAQQGISFSTLRRRALEKHILREFLKKKRVIAEIAQELRISHNNVYMILRRNGVKTPRGGRRVGEWKNKYFEQIEVEVAVE